MTNISKPLANSFLIPLGLYGTASAEDAGIHKKILGSGTTILIISNDEMEDIIKISRSLEDSGLLLKGVGETTQTEAKERKGRFLSMLLDTLGPSLLSNILTGKEMNTARERFLRAGYGSSIKKKTIFNATSYFN